MTGLWIEFIYSADNYSFRTLEMATRYWKGSLMCGFAASCFLQAGGAFAQEFISSSSTDAHSPWSSPILFSPVVLPQPGSLAPPTNFQGQVVEDRYMTQLDVIHKLTWVKSTDTAVSNYKIFRNGKLIGKVNTFSPPVFLDHNRRKNIKDVYTIKAVTKGATSVPVSIIVP